MLFESYHKSQSSGTKMGVDQRADLLYYTHCCTGCSAAWLAYLHGVQVVGGSNPLIPTRLYQELLLCAGAPFS